MENVRISKVETGPLEILDIYDSLDKEEFLNKINALIEGYGNLINTYTIVVCIEADEPIKLLSFIKSE